jgi:hypothetical protein
MIGNMLDHMTQDRCRHYLCSQLLFAIPNTG